MTARSGMRMNTTQPRARQIGIRESVPLNLQNAGRRILFWKLRPAHALLFVQTRCVHQLSMFALALWVRCLEILA